MCRSLFWTTTGLLTLWAGSALAQAPAPALTPFSEATGPAPPPPWRAAGLPGGKVPLSSIRLAELDGRRVARLAAEGSYGTLVHDVAAWVPSPGATLAWRWRLDQPLAHADLRTREGDDAALKVCVLFDMPLSALPFGERTLLRMARAVSGEPLPAATLCYVWDTSLPAGTTLPNAWSRRVRWHVLDGPASPVGQWRAHQRNLRDDFLQAFGQESATVPPITALLIGADADNTGGRSLGYVGDLRLAP
ncbi:MAG: DUF3047 domain-containing protein [Ramlibacter sp.]|nr:DUF3047 domain-containing protein [Ramlibacter sp.]